MTALKYWDGAQWVTLPDSSAKQVWTGPDAPVPIGDHRLWIDTDEPDSALVASPAWQSITYGTATGAITGWQLAPMPADANFFKTGDSNAFVRNVDGSLTVRDAGVYQINASVQIGGAPSEAKYLIIQKGVSLAANVVGDFLCQNGSTVAQASMVGGSFVGYLPAGQVISLLSYSLTGSARQVLHFSIARIGTGPQGVPGPVGPGGLINTQRVWGTANSYFGIASGQEFSVSSGVVMRLYYTPPVNCWWEITFHIGNLNKLDVAYHYSQPSISIVPNDADGLSSFNWTKTQHAGVQQYEPYDLTGLFKLNAGQAYEIRTGVGFSGGTWQYYCAPSQLYLIGKAWAR